jgi:hypothetical protein
MITYYNGEGKVMATSDGMPSGRAAPRRLFQPVRAWPLRQSDRVPQGAVRPARAAGGASAEAGGVRDLLGPPDG